MTKNQKKIWSWFLSLVLSVCIIVAMSTDVVAVQNTKAEESTISDLSGLQLTFDDDDPNSGKTSSKTLLKFMEQNNEEMATLKASHEELQAELNELKGKKSDGFGSIALIVAVAFDFLLTIAGLYFLSKKIDKLPEPPKSKRTGSNMGDDVNREQTKKMIAVAVKEVLNDKGYDELSKLVAALQDKVDGLQDKIKPADVYLTRQTDQGDSLQKSKSLATKNAGYAKFTKSDSIKDITAAFRKLQDALANPKSGNLKTLRDSFARQYNVQPFKCINSTERQAFPGTPPKFGAGDITEGRFWAIPIGDKYAVFPNPLMSYDESGHAQGGLSELFDSNYEGSNYKNIEVLSPAVISNFNRLGDIEKGYLFLS